MTKQRRNAEAPAGPERLSLREFVPLLLGLPARAEDYHARVPPPRTGNADVDTEARLHHAVYADARRRFQEDPEKFLAVVREIAGLTRQALPLAGRARPQVLDPVDDPRLHEAQERYLRDAGKGWLVLLESEGLRTPGEGEPRGAGGPRAPRGFEIHPVVVEPGTKAELAAMTRGIKEGFEAAQRVRAGRGPGAPVPADLSVPMPEGVVSGSPEAFYHQQGVARGKLQWNPGEVQLLVQRVEAEFEQASKASREYFTNLKSLVADRAAFLKGYTDLAAQRLEAAEALESDAAARRAAVEQFMRARRVPTAAEQAAGLTEPRRLPQAEAEKLQAESLAAAQAGRIPLEALPPELAELGARLAGSIRRDPSLDFWQRLGVSLGPPSSSNPTATTTKYRTTEKISPALLGLPVPLDKKNRPVHRTCWLIIQDGRVVDMATGLGGRFGVRRMIRAYNQVWWSGRAKQASTKATPYEKAIVRVRKLTEEARELQVGLRPVSEAEIHAAKIATIQSTYESLSAEERGQFEAAADVLNNPGKYSALAAEEAQVTADLAVRNSEIAAIDEEKKSLDKTQTATSGFIESWNKRLTELSSAAKKQKEAATVAAGQITVRLMDIQQEYDRVLQEVDPETGKLRYQRWTVLDWVPGLRRGQQSLSVTKQDLPCVLLGYTQELVQQFLTAIYGLDKPTGFIKTTVAKMLEGMTSPRHAVELLEAYMLKEAAANTARHRGLQRTEAQLQAKVDAPETTETQEVREATARRLADLRRQIAMETAGLAQYEWTFTPGRGLFAAYQRPVVAAEFQVSEIAEVKSRLAEAKAQLDLTADKLQRLTQQKKDLEAQVKLITAQRAALRVQIGADTKDAVTQAKAVFHIKPVEVRLKTGLGPPRPDKVETVALSAPPVVHAAYGMLVLVEIPGETQRMTPLEFLQRRLAETKPTKAQTAQDLEATERQESQYQEKLEELTKARARLHRILAAELASYAASALTPEGQLRAPSGLVKKRLKQVFTEVVVSTLSNTPSLQTELSQGSSDTVRNFLQDVLSAVVTSDGLRPGADKIREHAFDEVLSLLVGIFKDPLVVWARGAAEISAVLAEVPPGKAELADLVTRVRPRVEKLLEQLKRGEGELRTLVDAMGELVCGLLPVWLPVPMEGQSRVIALEASSFFGWGNSPQDAPYIWYPAYSPTAAAGRLQLFLESTSLPFFKTSGDVPREGRARPGSNWIMCYPDSVAINQVVEETEAGVKPRSGYYTFDYTVDAGATEDDFGDGEFEDLLSASDEPEEPESESSITDAVETLPRPNLSDDDFADEAIFTVPVTPYMVEATSNLFLRTCSQVRRAVQYRFGPKQDRRYNIYMVLGSEDKVGFRVAGLYPVKAKVPLVGVKPGKLTTDAIRDALVQKFITETGRAPDEAALETSRHLHAPATREVLEASPYRRELAGSGLDLELFPYLDELEDPVESRGIWSEIRRTLQLSEQGPRATKDDPSVQIQEVYSKFLEVPAERRLDLVPLVALKRAVLQHLTRLLDPKVLRAYPRWFPAGPSGPAPARRLLQAVKRAGGPPLSFAVEAPRQTAKGKLQPRTLGPGAVLLHAIGALGARHGLNPPDDYLALFRACLVEVAAFKIKGHEGPLAIPNDAAVPVSLDGGTDDPRLWVQSDSSVFGGEESLRAGRLATVTDVIEGDAGYAFEDAGDIAEYTGALRVLLERLDDRVATRTTKLAHLDEAGKILQKSDWAQQALLGFLVGTSPSRSQETDREGRVVVPYGFLVRIGLKRLGLGADTRRVLQLVDALRQGTRDLLAAVGISREMLGREAWRRWQETTEHARPAFVQSLEDVTPEVLDRWLVPEVGPWLPETTQLKLFEAARPNPGRVGRSITVFDMPPLVMWATMLYAPRTGPADHRLEQGIGKGLQALTEYGALDESGALTPTGHRMFREIAQEPLETGVRHFLELVAEARLQRRIPGALRENRRGVLLSGETPLTRAELTTEAGSRLDAVLLRPRVPVEVKQADGSVVTYETRPRIWVPVDQVEEVRARWPELRRGVAARVVQNVSGFNQELLGWQPPNPEVVEPRYLNQEVVAERRLRLANTKPAEGKDYPRVAVVKPKYRKEDPKDPDPWRGKLGPGNYQAPTPGNPRGRAQRIRQARATARQVAAFGGYPGVGGQSPTPPGPKGGGRGPKGGGGLTGVVSLGPQVPGSAPAPRIRPEKPQSLQGLLALWVSGANELFATNAARASSSVLGRMSELGDPGELQQAGDPKLALNTAGLLHPLATQVEAVADRLYAQTDLKGVWRVLQMYADVLQHDPGAGASFMTRSNEIWGKVLSNIPRDQKYSAEDRAWAILHTVIPVLRGEAGQKLVSRTAAAQAKERELVQQKEARAREVEQEEAREAKQGTRRRRVEASAAAVGELRPEGDAEAPAVPVPSTTPTAVVVTDDEIKALVSAPTPGVLVAIREATELWPNPKQLRKQTEQAKLMSMLRRQTPALSPAEQAAVVAFMKGMAQSSKN